MKIRKITINNIRCFDHLEIDFTDNDQLKDWIVILGDNGVGKSTILRSIALGLTEESGAGGLLDELPGEWIKYDAPNKSGFIEVELEPFKNCKEEAKIHTKFTINDFQEVEVRQTVTPPKPESYSWDDLFVCAYGASRSEFAAEEHSDYTITDAIYTLFKYGSKLQSPELNVRRLQTLDISKEEIFSKLEPILMLPKGAISIEFSGLKVSGPWGEKMPYGALSDGYRVVMSMLTDALGWKGLNEGTSEDPDKEKVLNLEGIIIIDELEQHLHPKWQKEIIGLLREIYPNVQFIISTHSPLCVVGTTELEDKDCALIALDRVGKTIKYEKGIPPHGKRADQVLTSYLFDLYTSSDNSIKKDIIRYKHLLQVKDTESVKGEIQEIVNRLDGQLGTPETEFELLIEKAIHKGLEELTKNDFEKDSPEDFEIKRQLKDLFEL